MYEFILGYTDVDLAAVPDGAGLGLGCGNPQAIAGARGGRGLRVGLASLALSPCHLASIPLIVAFINGDPATSTRRAGWLAAWFANGIFAAIVIVGATPPLLAGLSAMSGRGLATSSRPSSSSRGCR